MNALGVFVKQPIAGRVKTRLAERLGAQFAADLYAAFTADVIEAVRDAADARTLCYWPPTPAARAYFAQLARDDFSLWPQPAGPLGERLREFFRHCFAQGAGRVVAIGSDSPTLPPRLVGDAFDRLQAADCVLGPASDGGYYLIGLRADQPELFDQIEWSTPRVLEQTVARAKAAGLSLATLPPWYDVDTAEDLGVLRRHLTALASAGECLNCENTRRWLNLHTGGEGSSL